MFQNCRLAWETGRARAPKCVVPPAAIRHEVLRTKLVSTHMSNIKLPAALVRQIGKKTDSALAQEFSVSYNRVRAERLKLGIASRKQQKWTPEVLASLGTESDEKIAKRLGAYPSEVTRIRQRLGISPFGMPRERKSHKWKRSEIKLLGKLPDAKIARQLGIDPSTVAWKRRGMGINKATAGRRERQWTKRELAMLGKKPDSVVAAVIGTHRHQVAMKRASLGIENCITRRNRNRNSV
jgi:hypothetical protein